MGCDGHIGTAAPHGTGEHSRRSPAARRSTHLRLADPPAVSLHWTPAVGCELGFVVLGSLRDDGRPLACTSRVWKKRRQSLWWVVAVAPWVSLDMSVFVRLVLYASCLCGTPLVTRNLRRRRGRRLVLRAHVNRGGLDGVGHNPP